MESKLAEVSFSIISPSKQKKTPYIFQDIKTKTLLFGKEGEFAEFDNFGCTRVEDVRTFYENLPETENSLLSF
jgi:hypothetical protein